MRRFFIVCLSLGHRVHPGGASEQKERDRGAFYANRQLKARIGGIVSTRPETYAIGGCALTAVKKAAECNPI